MSGNDNRALSTLKQPYRFLHGCGVTCRPRPIRDGPIFLSRAGGLIDHFDKHVQRYIDVYRPRPAIGHQRKGLPESERQHVRPRGLEAALHIGAEHIHEIALKIFSGLLKRSPVPLASGDISSDVEHR
jgi:hypothetical protein